MKQFRSLCICLLALCAITLAVSSASAQSSRRDYMTDAEVELVRDAQDIDSRIDVLTKMIDRRFAVLKLDVGGAQISSKEAGKWGPAPEGTRMEILDDIRKLLDKAIDDIDDTAMHPNKYIPDPKRSEKQKQKDEARFPNSVKNLAASAKRYQPALKTLLDKAADEREKGLILGAIESCDEIISAITKLTSGANPN